MQGLQAQAAELLYDGELGEREIDLSIRLCEWGAGGAEIMQVGGRWDRADRRWVGDTRRGVTWRVHPGQYDAAYFFRDWYRAKCRGERVAGWEQVYVILGAGGRGAGKSDLGVRAGVMVAVGMREQVVWYVSPVEEETEELQRAIESNTPGLFYAWRKAELAYTFWNGSRITMMSGYAPGSLKRGRVDYWLLNEAQRFPLEAYKMIRPRLADTAGLGFIAANPPREAKGRWVMEFYDRSKARKLPGIRLFEFDPKQNPTIDLKSLEVLRPEFGEEDYRREILGEMLPIGDLVMYAWSDLLDEGNVRAAPDVGDCTREFTRRTLGREFDQVVGLDFQLAPHMAGAVARFFIDPTDRSRERPFSWYTDELTVDGTEDDLCDALEAKGYEPDRTALICDASGWWQDAERKKGRSSVEIMKRRGWKHCYKPDRKMEKNPLIVERVLAANARFCSSEQRPDGAVGVRRAFVVPGCVTLCRAMKFWENRNGVPHRRSEFAHHGDALTYVEWRFFPRRTKSKPFAYEGGKRIKSEFEEELEDLV